MPHDIRSCLADILTSIEAIDNYLSENLGDRRDFNLYLQNRLLRRGVERELEIIGEATRRITKVDSNFPLENTRGIIGLRNLVAHAYDNVNDTYIWAIIVNHLAPLKAEVERLLAE